MIARHRSQARTNQSRSFAEKKHRRKVVLTAVALAAISSWFYISWAVSRLTAFEISDVRVRGATESLSRDIRAISFQELDGFRLALYPRSNSLIYPRRSIAAVAAADPRVASVNVGRDGLRAIVVTVSEKAAAAEVCRDFPDWDNGRRLDRCYEADAFGKIIRSSSTSTEEVDRYYVPSLPIEPIGLHATSTEEFLVLDSFLESVRDVGISPLGILMKEGREYELYVEGPAGGGTVTIVYFNTGSDLAKQVSNLATFWGRVATKIASSAGSNLEYVDVRYGSNVFYRISGQSSEQ